jgi:hypothetical protein
MPQHTLYDRPVRELLAEAVQALTPPLRPRDIVRWFRTHYPRVNDKTVRAHVRAGTVNDPNRLHYSMRVGNLLYRRSDGLLDRYDPANPPEDAGDWADQPLPEELPDAIQQAGVVRIPGNTELMRRRNYDLVRRILLDGESYTKVAALHGMRPRRVERIVALAKGAPSKRQPIDSGSSNATASRGTIVESDESSSRGRWFEEESLTASSKHFGMALAPAVLTLSGGVTQGFDLVSEDESVVGMVVPTPEVRSAEMVLASISERVWLLESLESPPSVRFVLSADRELLAIWLSHYGRAAEDLDFYVLRDGQLNDVRAER